MTDSATIEFAGGVIRATTVSLSGSAIVVVSAYESGAVLVIAESINGTFEFVEFEY